MAKVVGQNIPSELYKLAKKVGLIADSGGRVKKKYPEKISQPGTTAQLRVWEIFKLACDYWKMQPETGGATPPEIGPRARTWWYDHAPYKTPIYRNWFMEETLILLHQGIIPDWCKYPHGKSGD